jgi:hypothetical protein
MPGAEANWYYVVNGKRFGPVNAAELKELARTGRLAGGDLVWTERLGQWVPANTVKGLFLQVPPNAVSNSLCYAACNCS